MEKNTFESGQVYNLKESVSIAEGGVVSKQFIKNNGGNISFFGFDKGQGLSEHTAPFEVWCKSLKGRRKYPLMEINQ